MKKDIYRKIIKRKMHIIVSLLITLTIFLTMIVISMNNYNKDQYILIDVLGKQRMLTQMISKDVNTKYELIDSIGYSQQVEFINKSLNQSKLDFDATMISLRTGVVYYNGSKVSFENSLNQIKPLIDQTYEEWLTFSHSVDVLINMKQINEEYIMHLNYINEHNLELLENCEQILQSIISYHNYQANLSVYISIGCFIISLILIFIVVFQLQKYIILPLNELYKSIFDLGFLNKNQSFIFPTKKQLQPVIDEINSGFNNLNNLIQLIEKINEETSFEGTLNYIYNYYSQFIPYTHIGIALLRDNDETLEAAYGISDPAIKEKFSEMVGLKTQLKNTSLSDIINKGTIRVINDLEEYNKNKDSKYNKILRSAGIKSSITLPLKVQNKPVGVIFFSSIHKNIYTKQHISCLETLSSSIAISFSKNIFIDELIYSTIMALAKMAESRDEETGDHLDRMKNYAVKITECLYKEHLFTDTINHEFIRNIEKFSPLHDIGKVGVRDGILLKPGKLTPEEYDEMKKHTVYGAEVLETAEKHIAKSNKSIFKFGIEIAHSHHEKWDGTGYPNNITGEEIPLSSRIVAVADVLDALTSKRPYKQPFTFEDSFNIIVSGKGKHFDPVIVDTIIKYREDIYQIYKNSNM